MYNVNEVSFLNVGENIRKIRKSQKLTLKELGKRINLSEQAIGQYERGNRRPSIETLIEIANALDVSPLVLIGENKDIFLDFMQGLEAEDKENVMDEMYDNDFKRISNFLNTKGYNVKLDHSDNDNNDQVTILKGKRIVATMSDVDFLNSGNDMLKSIENFIQFSVQEFFNKNGVKKDFFCPEDK